MALLFSVFALNECMLVYSNEQFWDTFPLQDFFPDNFLTVNKIPDISLTYFKLPGSSRFSKQVVTLWNSHYQNADNAIRSAFSATVGLLVRSLLIHHIISCSV